MNYLYVQEFGWYLSAVVERDAWVLLWLGWRESNTPEYCCGVRVTNPVGFQGTDNTPKVKHFGVFCGKAPSLFHR